MSALAGAKPRYAIWPVNSGDAISRSRAASSALPRCSASPEIPLYIVQRTAERILSLPTTKSHVAVVPSLKLSVMGSVGEGSKYDTMRLANWILSSASRCLARSFWRIGLWNVCTEDEDHGFVRRARVTTRTSHSH